jgi:hypothetical protein
MSTTSSTSTIVSFRGDEAVELDTALNELYMEIQQNLNYSQCSIRQLACSSEQDNDFMVAVNIYHELDNYVLGLLALFKELQDVSKQCLGKCPPEHKEEYKKMCDDRKERQKKEKEQMKELEKNMKMLNNIKE